MYSCIDSVMVRRLAAGGMVSGLWKALLQQLFRLGPSWSNSVKSG